MAPHRVCDWADRKHHTVTRTAGAAREHRMGKLHQPHSQGKLTPEPLGRGGCSRAIAGRGHTAVPPSHAWPQLLGMLVGAWLPSAILPTLAFPS